MKLKVLFQKMREDFEVNCDKETFDVCNFDIKKRKKTRVSMRKNIEFYKYLDELRELEEIKKLEEEST